MVSKPSSASPLPAAAPGQVVQLSRCPPEREGAVAKRTAVRVVAWWPGGASFGVSLSSRRCRSPRAVVSGLRLSIRRRWLAGGRIQGVPVGSPVVEAGVRRSQVPRTRPGRRAAVVLATARNGVASRHDGEASDSWQHQLNCLLIRRRKASGVGAATPLPGLVLMAALPVPAPQFSTQRVGSQARQKLYS